MKKVSMTEEKQSFLGTNMKILRGSASSLQVNRIITEKKIGKKGIVVAKLLEPNRKRL